MQRLEFAVSLTETVLYIFGGSHGFGMLFAETSIRSDSSGDDSPTVSLGDLDSQ